jgi:hypothetical protein
MERPPDFKSALEGTRLIRFIKESCLTYQRPVIAAIQSKAAIGADWTCPAVTTGDDA